MTLQWESRLADHEYPHADDGLKIKDKSIKPSIYIQILKWWRENNRNVVAVVVAKGKELK